MMKTQTPNHVKGFTLPELLIVVLVVAILATIAYPSYDTYVRNSRIENAYVLNTRIENARADMLYNAQLLERHYVQNRSFTGFSADNFKQNSYFAISIASQSADHFSLQALPSGSSNANEQRVLRLDDSNILRICDSSAATSNCTIK